MNKRVFFFSAHVFVIAAVVLHCVARSFLDEAMRRKALGINQAMEQHTHYNGDPLAMRASHLWSVLSTIGVVLTALSAVWMVVASIRHEPGSYIILLLLLFFAIGTPMLL
jgi:hypothetical protein